MIILTPTFSQSSGEKIGRLIGADTQLVEYRVFPNGEVLARINQPESIKGNNVVLYYPTYPDTNNRVIHLLQTLEILGHYNAENITLIIPYLSYCRQDKRFREGESLSLKLLLDILYDMNVDLLISINPHSKETLKKYSKFKVETISLFKPLINKLLSSITEANRDDIIFISPDLGRCKDVKKLAESFGVNHICLEKIRDRDTGEISYKYVDEIKGYRLGLIIDDEISTGGTMALAIKYLNKYDIKYIYTAAIHLLLINNAEKKIFSAGASGIFGTNTVENPFYVIRIEEYIADKLRMIGISN